MLVVMFGFVVSGPGLFKKCFGSRRTGAKVTIRTIFSNTWVDVIKRIFASHCISVFHKQQVYE